LAIIIIIIIFLNGKRDNRDIILLLTRNYIIFPKGEGFQREEISSFGTYSPLE
jgi:hypothetical protein